MIYFDQSIEKLTRIKVMGLGGGGCNTVDRMIESGFDQVEYICANTDVQALLRNKALEKIQMGPQKTKGLGAGGNPVVGRESAEESIEEIREFLVETDILFLLAGFGGGTGTGALPVVAQVAKEMGILTVPVITKPFLFEGRKRSQSAEDGIKRLLALEIALIIVPNEKLLGMISEETSVEQAFLLTDKYLMSCVESLYGLLTQVGLINVDFADVRTVMSHPGLAVLGQGTGEGKLKVSEAVDKALSSPILEKENLVGAKGLLIHVRGGKDLSLMEVNKAISKVEALTDPAADLIFGTTLDEKAENKAHVTIIATGLVEKKFEVVQEKPRPVEQKQEPKAEAKPEPKEEPKPELIFLQQESQTVVTELEFPHLYEELKKEEPKPEIKQEIELEKPKLEKKPRQGVIPFTNGQKGKFEKAEPTLYDGEDLDVPTFIRKKKLFDSVSEEEVF